MSSDFNLLDLKSGLSRQPFFEKQNAVEPSVIRYLAECYSRAENECKPEVRKKGKVKEETDDDFNAMKESIVRKCQHEIVDKARYVRI